MGGVVPLSYVCAPRQKKKDLDAGDKKKRKTKPQQSFRSVLSKPGVSIFQMCLQHWWNESVIQEVCVCNCRECWAPLQEHKSVLLSHMCKRGPLLFTSPSKWLKSRENEHKAFKVLTKLTVILNVGVRLHKECLRSNYHWFKNLPDKQAINRSPKGPNAPREVSNRGPGNTSKAPKWDYV